MWVEVRQSLPTHHKTDTVADALGISAVQVVGHLVCLWLWALDNAPLGAFAGDGRRLERGARWEGEPHAFVTALVDAGLLDRDEGAAGYRIHDWEDYAGRLMARRAAEAARKRLARARLDAHTAGAGHPADGRRTSGGRAQDGARLARRTGAATVPHLTVPHRTLPVVNGESVKSETEAPDTGASPPAEARKRPRDLLWETFTVIFGEPRTPQERLRLNAAVAQVRQGARERGAEITEAAEWVTGAHRNWANVMGTATETPHGLVTNLGLLLDGPQVQGRSEGKAPPTAVGPALRSLAEIEALAQAADATEAEQGGRLMAVPPQVRRSFETRRAAKGGQRE